MVYGLNASAPGLPAPDPVESGTPYTLTHLNFLDASGTIYIVGQERKWNGHGEGHISVAIQLLHRPLHY